MKYVNCWFYFTCGTVDTLAHVSDVMSDPCWSWWTIWCWLVWWLMRMLLLLRHCAPGASVIAQVIFQNFTLPVDNNMSFNKIIIISWCC